jgi:hypothetical protein
MRKPVIRHYKNPWVWLGVAVLLGAISFGVRQLIVTGIFASTGDPVVVQQLTEANNNLQSLVAQSATTTPGATNKSTSSATVALIVDAAKARATLLYKVMETSPSAVFSNRLPTQTVANLPDSAKKYVEVEFKGSGKIYSGQPDDFNNNLALGAVYTFIDSVDNNGYEITYSNQNALSKLSQAKKSVQVSGVKLFGRVAADKLADENLLSALTPTVLAAPNKGDPEIKKIAVILMTPQQQPYNQYQVKDKIFSRIGISANSIYRSNSNNLWEFQGINNTNGDIYGWYNVDPNVVPSGQCPGIAWAQQANVIARQDPSFAQHEAEYSNVIYIMPSQTTCYWAGYASLSGKTSVINGSSLDNMPFVVSHELGHNYGLHHANLIVGSSGQSSEYKDQYDFMGNAQNMTTRLSSANRVRLGWINGDQLTVSHDGPYVIDGSKSVRIPVAYTYQFSNKVNVVGWLYFDMLPLDPNSPGSSREIVARLGPEDGAPDNVAYTHLINLRSGDHVDNWRNVFTDSVIGNTVEPGVFEGESAVVAVWDGVGRRFGTNIIYYKQLSLVSGSASVVIRVDRSPEPMVLGFGPSSGGFVGDKNSVLLVGYGLDLVSKLTFNGVGEVFVRAPIVSVGLTSLKGSVVSVPQSNQAQVVSVSYYDYRDDQSHPLDQSYSYSEGGMRMYYRPNDATNNCNGSFSVTGENFSNNIRAFYLLWDSSNNVDPSSFKKGQVGFVSSQRLTLGTIGAKLVGYVQEAWLVDGNSNGTTNNLGGTIETDQILGVQPNTGVEGDETEVTTCSYKMANPYLTQSVYFDDKLAQIISNNSFANGINKVLVKAPSRMFSVTNPVDITFTLKGAVSQVTDTLAKSFTYQGASILSPDKILSTQSGAPMVIEGSLLGKQLGTVTFDGQSTNVLYWSDTAVVAIIPMKNVAQTTLSTVAVRTADNKESKKMFNYYPRPAVGQPFIRKTTPVSSKSGTVSMDIEGEGFGTTAGSVTMSGAFGIGTANLPDVKIISWTSTKIKVTFAAPKVTRAVSALVTVAPKGSSSMWGMFGLGNVASATIPFVYLPATTTTTVPASPAAGSGGGIGLPTVNLGGGLPNLKLK